MTDVKFTPGPWKEDGIMIVGANGEDVCFMHEPAQYAGDVSTPAGPNTEANAHLIAASPDLYASDKALADIAGRLAMFVHMGIADLPSEHDRSVATKLCEIARDALRTSRDARAKAEGRS